MIVGLKYIYDEAGNVEAAIVPIEVWRGIELEINGNGKPMPKKFKPSKYKGLLKHYDFDVEGVIKQMRSEWDRNF
ncbi:MAG: hypothetical protein HC892_07175 [Saprospiraceae bacterium]|nr:hypothetical protein [Saprospiraceae bacterium]